MEAWGPPEVEELGASADLGEAFGAVVDRICADSGLSRRGPWEMHTDAEAHVDEQRIVMQIELRVRPCSRCASLPVH